MSKCVTDKNELRELENKATEITLSKVMSRCLDEHFWRFRYGMAFINLYSILLSRACRWGWWSALLLGSFVPSLAITENALLYVFCFARSFNTLFCTCSWNFRRFPSNTERVVLLFSVKPQNDSNPQSSIITRPLVFRQLVYMVHHLVLHHIRGCSYFICLLRLIGLA